jgi:CRP/FNR family transcriptional regulator
MSGSDADLNRTRKSCELCSLYSLCLPAGLSGEDLKALDTVIRNRRPFRRGDVLYRAGQALRSIFIVREGAFKTTLTNEDGVLQIIGFQMAGEIIGLDGMASGIFECEAQALTNANLCEIPLSELEQLANRIPVLHHQLLQVIGHDIRRDHEHIELLGRKGADERIALFFQGLSTRYRKLGISGHFLVLPMNREDIANYLGMALETISRTLSKLQDEGLIEVRGRQIEILNSAGMYALAHASASVTADHLGNRAAAVMETLWQHGKRP